MKNRKLLYISLILIGLCLITYGVLKQVEYYAEPREMKKLKELILLEEDTKESTLFKKVNVTKLREINKDVWGWVYIPNTNIDFYVMQEQVPLEYYYSNHNIYKDYKYSGSVFIPAADVLIDDPRTIMLGHAIIGEGRDSMFTQITHFNNKDFFDKHEYIYTFKDLTNTKWRIVYSLLTDENDIMYNYSIKRDSKDHLDLLKHLQENYTNKRDIEIKTTDDLLILATCDWSKDKSGRAYIVAIKEDTLTQVIE